MCDYCVQTEKINITSPQVFEQTVKYIKELIDKNGFIFFEGNCAIGEHKKNGHWITDIIYHKIKCPKCGQVFECVVDTYHGGGSFRPKQ